jgi:hypothetical protein
MAAFLLLMVLAAVFVVAGAVEALNKLAFRGHSRPLIHSKEKTK